MMMFAELVCQEMTPAKWRGGASIFRGLAYLEAVAQQADEQEPQRNHAR
jgi:hypothetical protein